MEFFAKNSSSCSGFSPHLTYEYTQNKRSYNRSREEETEEEEDKEEEKQQQRHVFALLLLDFDDFNTFQTFLPLVVVGEKHSFALLMMVVVVMVMTMRFCATKPLLSKRDLMKRVAGGASVMLSSSSGLILPGLVPSSAFAAAGEEASSASVALPKIPRTEVPLKFTQEYPSAVIKGCWQLSGGHKGDPADDRTSKDKGAVEDFETFVNAGITTFDTGPTACGYGDSELVIGDFLKRNRNSEQCRVHTKLCCVGREQVAMTEKWVKENAFDVPSKRLGGLKKIDMVQMYWNDYGSSQYIDCALHLTDLKAKGLIGSVALTNFNTKKMEEMINKGAEISSNQIQYSLLDRRPDLKMNEFCKASGVKLLPYGVLAGGFLSSKFLETDVKDVVLDTGSKRKYSSVIRNFGGWGNLQKLLKVLDSIGKKHDQSIANVATRWVLEKESVLAVILGARNDFHVEDHQKLFQFTLDAEDKSKIDEVLSSTTKATGDCYDWERGGKW